ncbi:alpha/beta hydrolase [Caulobacter sp. 73W]|uniref:Alpha/beta hydrolase n=1 Tax=Caulobacter sp. 73W TaxID=3161137 RepID=A0AB39KWD0_9CAUL
MVATPSLACEPGLYRYSRDQSYAAITKPAAALRYTLDDGRRGEVGAADAVLNCQADRITSTPQGGTWDRVPLTLTATRFESHGQALSGVLVEPPGLDGPAPLVVLVHGSERTSPMTGAYPYLLASFGLRVFAYDKRGTGGSEGEYTQNFELLADDAAAAFAQARKLAAGRITRAGFYGGSQGGWVAPLASVRAKADFVAVGFGLMISPAEEDREQVLTELKEHGASARDLEEARVVTDATARLVGSHFEQGYRELAQAKKRFEKRAWFSRIRGEYTGEILATDEAELRRVGRALFDNLELIWNYDSVAVLRQLKSPLLWVIAEEDREAPPAITLSRLTALRDQGAAIDVFSFPNTDHGMVEFTQGSDGGRTYGRITDGYFRLLADWIRGGGSSDYGRGRRR